MNITEEMVDVAAIAITRYDYQNHVSVNGEVSAHQRAEARAALEAAAPLIAAQALREAYWKLREHASGLRATEVYRKASERREGTLGESPAHQRYRWLEATARGIEDGARDLAELLGVPENEIERS
jgi:hypothetical protein